VTGVSQRGASIRVTEAEGPGHCPSVERNVRASIFLLPLLLGTSACIVDLGKLGEEATDATSDDGASGPVDPTGDVEPTGGGSSDTDGDTDGGPGMPVPAGREVDILFVIDNSGSMAEEQAKLALAIPSLVGVLESAGSAVDYRIGVTTTDNGNPWCSITTPEAGRLRATSCRARAQEFTWNGAVMIEAFDDACAALCPEALAEVPILDGAPWIDVRMSDGTTNVGTSVIDALRCVLPQGIDGCGFEAPLESAFKSILRFDEMTDPAFGFHREGALLAVMIVSDEVDCSANPAWDEIFLPEGNRVFWSNPNAASPTSAVCWNAGVACIDTGMGLLDCGPEDYDVDGNPGASADQAVLHPLGRYTNALLAKGAYVSAIYGMGADGSVTYKASADPQFQSDFGVGPGCQSPSGMAVPPVRMRQLVSDFGGNPGSICANDFGGSLAAFGQGILARLPQ
jgi:hypothetical protein